MKNLLRLIPIAALAGLLAWAPGARAIDLVGEDTDLFMTNPAISSEIPNVLIILDNTSNWSAANQKWEESSGSVSADSVCGTGAGGAGMSGSKQGDAELCAIYRVAATLTDIVNVGLMMINDSDGGGYIMFPMKSMNATNRTALQTKVKAIATAGITSPNYKTSANNTPENVMNDAFRYFNSFATFGGSGAASAEADVSAYGSSAKTNFAFSNKPTNSCGYDYIIWIGNGWPSGNQSSSTLATTMNAATTLLNDSANVTPNTTPTAAACKGGTCNNSDAWSRFMYNFGTKVAAGSYRHITTYTVDVCYAACDTNQAQLLQSMATLSFGRYFQATNLSAIVTALTTIFAQVQAVNSVFAATTLPVSINVRGTNLNQVYIGVFRPDSQLSPRWLGNLKMYKLGVANSSTGQLQLVDATNTAAINLNTGFVANTAKSFWTSNSSFWSYRAPFKPTDAGGASDSADGDQVEKGGAAQRIREVYPAPDSTAAQTRKIYTCTGTCLTTAGTVLSGTLFDTTNADVTSALLGTFATVNVSSLTASGGLATAVTSSNHGFVTTDSVTISGAVPDLYNGTYVIAKVDDTTFTYTPSSSPDTTHGYVTLNTLSSSGLTVATDKITVTGATPNDYNVTDATISSVVGQTNQVSYTLSGTPTAAASGYTVSAKRLISNTANSANLQWSSSAPSTANVTVTRNSHGYSAGNTVTISGVKQSDGTTDQTGLNGSFTVAEATTNTFKYAASATPVGGTTQTGTVTMTSGIPSGWGNGTTVTIAGVTSETAYNASNASISNVNAVTGTFDYTTTTAVAADAVGASMTASRTIASDLSTWTVAASPTITTVSGSNRRIVMTLTRGKYSGQALQSLQAGDSISFSNCTYDTPGNSNTACTGLVIFSVSGSTSTTTTTVAADTYANISGTVTLTLRLSSGDANFQGVAVNGTAASAVPATNATLITRTAATSSSAFAVTSITRGAAAVNAYGTVYAQKTGDLYSGGAGTVTSITSQAISTGTVTAGLSTVADPNERENLINWVRGKDNKDNEDLDGIATDIRASVHGDVLHSRPAVINYNRSTGDNDVYIFYGVNDGMFHAIKGGFDSDGGNEQWAFVAQDHFGKLKRLRNQSATISSTNPRGYFFDGPIGAYTKDYDGGGALSTSCNGDYSRTDCDRVFLYVGMRRGGRYFYAFDVTEPTNPRFLWRKGCPNATGTTGCDAGWGEVGQSWSEPRLGYVRAYGNSRLVMFFGAGYDAPAEDFQPCGIAAWSTASVTGKTGVIFPNQMTAANCGSNFTSGTAAAKSRTMGRGIYMVDAVTGDVLWRAVSPNALSETVSGMTTVSVTGMDYAISADVSILKNRSNTAGRGSSGSESVTTGYLDRLYAVDLGGQVWRVDLADASVNNWVVNKFAKVTPTDGTGDTPPSKQQRKFMFQADVVYTSDANGDYDAVLTGTGDREHPFDQTVENRFYMFKDRNTGTLATPVAPDTAPATILESNLTDVTDNCLQAASNCTGGNTQSSVSSSLLANKGWMLKFENIGEKAVSPVTTTAGSVFFNTNQPAQDTVSGTAVNVGANAGNFCTSDLGTARQYAVDYQDATSNNIFTNLPSQYQSSSGRYATFAGGGFLPAPVPVVVQIDGKYYQTVIAGVQASNPGGLTLQTRVRSYWYNKTN